MARFLLFFIFCLSISFHNCFSASTPQTPVEVTQAIKDPILLGQHDFRWFVFDIYDIFLWAEKKPWNFDQTFALSITYQRAVSRQEFTDTTIDQLKKQDNIESEEKMYRQQLNYLYKNVEVGDRITAIYQKDQGLTFYLNGREMGKITNIDFAQRFINIWLGEKAEFQEMRKDLLG